MNSPLSILIVVSIALACVVALAHWHNARDLARLNDPDDADKQLFIRASSATPDQTVSRQLHRAMFNMVTQAHACHYYSASWFNVESEAELDKLLLGIAARLSDLGARDMGPDTIDSVLAAFDSYKQTYQTTYLEGRFADVITNEIRNYLSGFPGDTELYTHQVASHLNDILLLHSKGLLNQTIDRIIRPESPLY